MAFRVINTYVHERLRRHVRRRSPSVDTQNRPVMDT